MMNNKLLIAILLAVSSAVAGFLHPQSCFSTRVNQHSSAVMYSWLRKSIDQVKQFLGDGQLPVAASVVVADGDNENSFRMSEILEEKDSSKKVGRIIRTAYRAYNRDTSKPSSREYTTRKDAQLSVSISVQGVEGDYNHYRTLALQSTANRAVSILTSDSMDFLRSMHPSAQDGDLGENLYVHGVAHSSFRPGGKVSIGEQVLLEITEPIEPCANLCKLPYINSQNLTPKQRVDQCLKLISQLDVSDGLRGWYAKVLQPGTVRVGDTLRLV